MLLLYTFEAIEASVCYFWKASFDPN